VDARLQEDRLHVIKRGKRIVATSGLDELLIGVEGRFVLDDRGFEIQTYLFPSFVGAVLRLARMEGLSFFGSLVSIELQK
jgi:hypothetical protein